ncbi:MAG: esterase [Roseobacter sp.]|jgi:pimeloyl-ACP methyl ester carboxylesterase|nr:esterase [Roseobacter sp.]MBV48749.1 esterase [Roseobacter sp.]|tara:strand:+ start:8609 stop:9319 length:711 start_codon:yes stop_codon:yes gene_type:complete
MSDILLVHGSCHGAWCWRDLLPELRALGHAPRAIDLPGHGDDLTPVNDVTLDSYADAVLAASTPQTVVVGHSMGGFAISAAAQKNPAAMARLIYLCAYVPAAGMTLADMRKQAPSQPLMPAVRMADDGKSFTLDPTMTEALFYNDCPPGAAEFAIPRLCAQAIAPTTVALPDTRRAESLPRSYIRCMDDRTIPPAYQVTMTQDWPDKDVYEMATGHSPFLTDPARLARIIKTILSR